MRDVKIKKEFEENELFHVGVANLWGRFKDGVLWLCDEVCGKKRSKGDKCWWNEEVMEAMMRSK